MWLNTRVAVTSVSIQEYLHTVLFSITESGYQIIAPCPSEKFLEVLEEKNYRAISLDRVNSVFDSISKEKRNSYIQNALGSESNFSVLKSIMKEHSVSLKESMLVLDKVCSK